MGYSHNLTVIQGLAFKVAVGKRGSSLAAPSTTTMTLLSSGGVNDPG